MDVGVDVILTFDNALLYNDQDDEIWKLANSLKIEFLDMWKDLNKAVKSGASSTDDKLKTPKPRAKTVHKGGWECEICDDGGKLILCDKCARGWHAKCLQVDSVKQLPDPWHCRECPGGAKYLWEQKGGWLMTCKDLVNKLLKHKRAWPFASPVDPKALKLGDYKKIVKKPMDLGSIKAKLEEDSYTDLEESGEEFYKDVTLTFDNAMLYNDEGDEIWEHAAALKTTFTLMWAHVSEKLERLKKVLPEPKTPASGKSEKKDEMPQKNSARKDEKIMIHFHTPSSSTAGAGNISSKHFLSVQLKTSATQNVCNSKRLQLYSLTYFLLLVAALAS